MSGECECVCTGQDRLLACALLVTDVAQKDGLSTVKDPKLIVCGSVSGGQMAEWPEFYDRKNAKALFQAR